MVADRNGNIVQQNHFYPFGQTMAISTGHGAQPYKFTGKELDLENGLNLYDFEARTYDPSVGRFTSVDPLAEKYYSISPYAYCGNNPINAVDPDGKEIWFTYDYEKDEDGNFIVNANGGYNLTGVTMHVTGKVINVSSNSKVNMEAASDKISSQIEESFQGNVDGVQFTTDVNLSVANSMNDVDERDHVFALADFKKPERGGILQGIANDYGGKVAFIDADLFTGIWDEKHNLGPGNAAHEFGHLAGLPHSEGKDLMQENPGNLFKMWSTKITSGQLKSIYYNYQMKQLNRGLNFEKYRNKTMPNRGWYDALKYVIYK